MPFLGSVIYMKRMFLIGKGGGVWEYYNDWADVETSVVLLLEL